MPSWQIRTKERKRDRKRKKTEIVCCQTAFDLEWVSIDFALIFARNISIAKLAPKKKMIYYDAMIMTR